MEKKDYLLLDEKIVHEYVSLAESLPEYPRDTGKMRELKKELMDLCGVTELEAINILRGRNVADYIAKYAGRIQGKKIEYKKYDGEVQVVYQVSEEEKELFYDMFEE